MQPEIRRDAQAAAMNKPSHQLLVQTPSGTSRYKVVETRRLQEGIAEVTIAAGDWLASGTYEATYQAGDRQAAGSYAVYSCRSSEEPLLFVGTFTRAGVTWT
jgi:hypothetical protein